MTSTLVTVIVGVGGVVFGAASAGVVQSAIARVDRSREARAAARVLYIDLLQASTVIAFVRDSGVWAVRSDWFVESWAEHRTALALVLDTELFLAVSGAFHLLGGQLRQMHEVEKLLAGDTKPAPLTAEGRRLLEQAAGIVDAAMAIIYAASFTWRERRRGLELPEVGRFAPWGGESLD
jgi:hypothetical protein